jgi:hypothetical protein
LTAHLIFNPAHLLRPLQGSPNQRRAWFYSYTLVPPNRQCQCCLGFASQNHSPHGAAIAPPHSQTQKWSLRSTRQLHHAAGQGSFPQVKRAENPRVGGSSPPPEHCFSQQAVKTGCVDRQPATQPHHTRYTQNLRQPQAPQPLQATCPWGEASPGAQKCCIFAKAKTLPRCLPQVWLYIDHSP